MKECTGKNGCGSMLDLSNFSNNKATKDGLSRICRKCDYVKRKAHNKKNPTKAKEWELMSKYGITLEEYKSMYLSQEGKCTICTKEYRVLVVDHNHDTGSVRGLLCSNCNTGIGLLQDKPINLKRAMDYLLEKGYYG